MVWIFNEWSGLVLEGEVNTILRVWGCDLEYSSVIYRDGKVGIEKWVCLIWDRLNLRCLIV